MSRKIRKQTTSEYEEETTQSAAPSDATSEVDPVEAKVSHDIMRHKSPQLSAILDFLANPQLINSAGSETTNIIDRYSKKCYKIPDQKIPEFFRLLEACRKAGIRTMFTERQQEYSGFMIDFDILQDDDEDQINDDILQSLVEEIVQLLVKTLKFDENRDQRRETIICGITRKPKISFNEDKQKYKDGFHLLFPGVQIRRPLKKLIIDRIINSEILDRVLGDVKPATDVSGHPNYNRNSFLDINSAFVPIFFIGSSTKPGAPAYLLTHIFSCKINLDTNSTSCNRVNDLFSDHKTNICYEFSVNFEPKHAMIPKKRYEPTEKCIPELQEIERKSLNSKDVEFAKNFGSISMNAMHDAQVKELKDALDTLAPSRYEQYAPWYKVLCALASASPSYKDLAMYFSMKSKSKFNPADFEKYWNQALKGAFSSKRSCNIGSIYYWASVDNPERWKELRKNQVHQVLYEMVFEPHKEGILGHSDIATLLYKLLKHKYITDYPEGEKHLAWYEFIQETDPHIEGELYKWRRWKELPHSMSAYISDVLPRLFEFVLRKVKKASESAAGDLTKYYAKVENNFKATMRRLGDRPFKNNIIAEATTKFCRMGFSFELDKDPLIRGVANGILKLSTDPNQAPCLITGYHEYKVAKYTNVPYIPFDPKDPLTKLIITSLRNCFPDDEPDSHEFIMYYFASTLDGNPKESMFLIVVGGGMNGKTVLVELHKAAIGEIYGVKLPLSAITGKASNADSATPATMLLKDATLATYSESQRNEVLNVARIKELTGMETIAGRRLHQEMINFKPRCHHLVTTNFDFDIQCNDNGTWRRLVYLPLKITFVYTYDQKWKDLQNNKYYRPADDRVQDLWTSDPEIVGRYLGYMVYLHWQLYRKYKGKVRQVLAQAKHVLLETDKYRARQDLITEFLRQRLVKTENPKEETKMIDEIKNFQEWYIQNTGSTTQAKGVVEQFQNSLISNFIKDTARGKVLVGHRFLRREEKEPAEGEEYGLKEIFALEVPPDNFGIKSETSDEYYERLTKEFNEVAHLFKHNETTIAADAIPEYLDQKSELKAQIAPLTNTKAAKELYLASREDNVVISSSGVVMRKLEEPSYTADDEMDDFLTTMQQTMKYEEPIITL